jgi:hypothetical protein
MAVCYDLQTWRLCWTSTLCPKCFHLKKSILVEGNERNKQLKWIIIRLKFPMFALIYKKESYRQTDGVLRSSTTWYCLTFHTRSLWQGIQRIQMLLKMTVQIQDTSVSQSWVILGRRQYIRVKWYGDGWIIILKGFGRKRSSPNRSTIPEFVWRNWKPP